MEVTLKLLAALMDTFHNALAFMERSYPAKYSDQEMTNILRIHDAMRHVSILQDHLWGGKTYRLTPREFINRVDQLKSWGYIPSEVSSQDPTYKTISRASPLV